MDIPTDDVAGTINVQIDERHQRAANDILHALMEGFTNKPDILAALLYTAALAIAQDASEETVKYNVGAFDRGLKFLVYPSMRPDILFH